MKTIKRGRVIGFEVLVCLTVSGSPSRRWMRLQGSGGKLGDGCLASLNSEGSKLTVARVIDSVMDEARAQAEKGSVHEHVPTPDGPVSFKVIEHKGAKVEACREVRDTY